MTRSLDAAALGCAALLLVPTAAQAVTCQVFGYVKIDALDTYYCDENHLGTTICSGWAEKNLDSVTQPMAYIGIQVEEQPSGNNLGAATWTDGTGYYSVSWDAASCSGTAFKVRIRYKRHQPGYSGPPLRAFVW